MTEKESEDCEIAYYRIQREFKWTPGFSSGWEAGLEYAKSMQKLVPAGTELLSSSEVTNMVESRGRREGEIWKFDSLGLSLLINDIANKVMKLQGKINDLATN